MTTVAIAGAGGIGYASAAWLANAGHAVRIWSPRSDSAHALREKPLESEGVLQASVRVQVAASARDLVRGADVVLIAVPVNGHKAVIDAMVPDLSSGQTVIVSSMASLSALYLFERARECRADVTVASLGTTALTARRTGDAQVRIMTRRSELGLSCLPLGRRADALDVARALFGDVFVPETNCLASTLVNINPVAHGPLALFNWTRIERAENWPQYHYMTPRVAAVIERLDSERIALARAFGLQVRNIEAHFGKSFCTQATVLAEIAAELHAKRGGPPGPTDIDTRFLAEDVPYGLVFNLALAECAGVAMPATRTIVEMASLVTGQHFTSQNDLLAPLSIASTTRDQLLARVDQA
jgi:opine dehydrogenase